MITRQGSVYVVSNSSIDKALGLGGTIIDYKHDVKDLEHPAHKAIRRTIEEGMLERDVVLKSLPNVRDVLVVEKISDNPYSKESGVAGILHFDSSSVYNGDAIFLSPSILLSIRKEDRNCSNCKAIYGSHDVPKVIRKYFAADNYNGDPIIAISTVLQERFRSHFSEYFVKDEKILASNPFNLQLEGNELTRKSDQELRDEINQNTFYFFNDLRQNKKNNIFKKTTSFQV